MGGYSLSALLKCLSMGMDGLVYLFGKVGAQQLHRITAMLLLIVEMTMPWNGENIMKADVPALETSSDSHF